MTTPTQIIRDEAADAMIERANERTGPVCRYCGFSLYEDGACGNSMCTLSGNNNADTIIGLRALADFLEAQPEFAQHTGTTFNIFVPTAEDFHKYARMMGSIEKDMSSDMYATCRKLLSGRIKLDLYTTREAVCKKIVTGTKTEEKRVLRELSAEEQALLDSLYVTETVETEITEWECAPIIVHAADAFSPVGGGEAA